MLLQKGQHGSIRSVRLFHIGQVADALQAIKLRTGYTLGHVRITAGVAV